MKRGPDQRRGKGGRRPGAGRKSKVRKEIEAAAEKIVQSYIENHIKPVMETYVRLAKGRMVESKDRKTGRVSRRKVIDSRVTCHFVERLVPRAKEECSVEHKGKLAGTVIIETIDPEGMAAPRGGAP